MRKVMSGLVLMLLALGLPSLVAAQVTTPPGSYSFSIQARGSADVYETITTGRCRILTAGTFNTDAVVYTDANFGTTSTTLTSAGYSPTIALDSNGVCKWYAIAGSDTFDVIVYVDSGSYAGQRARVDGVTRQGLKQVAFDRAQGLKVKSIPFTQNITAQTSAIQLPAGAVVTAAVVETTVGIAGSTVSFGTAGLGITAFCNASTAPIAIGFTACSTTLIANVGSAAVGLQYVTSAFAMAGFLNVYYLPNGGN